MINKQKMSKSAGQKAEPVRGSKTAPSSAGPDNYDGRENMRADPPPPQTAAEGPGRVVSTEE
jgi:hypothetical protein